MGAQTRLSAKGQVVIPKDVRVRLGLIEGAVFDVIERDGEILLKPENRTAAGLTADEALRAIQSFYRYDGPPLSIADMDAAVHRAVTDHYDQTRSR